MSSAVSYFADVLVDCCINYAQRDHAEHLNTIAEISISRLINEARKDFELGLVVLVAIRPSASRSGNSLGGKSIHDRAPPGAPDFKGSYGLLYRIEYVRSALQTPVEE
jgi:hypothetical protein